MNLIPIGQAAGQLGLATSTLRYYDERGLVSPRTRRGGRRMYTSEELRRLAFLKLANRLGIPLAAAAAVLDAPSPQWRQTAREQIVELDELVAQAQAARTFLTNALECPTDHPTAQCSVMIRALDRLIAGTPVEELGAEYT